MHVAELWRYPVKSLKGEQIQEAHITSNGIPGDREIVVLNSAGRIVTSRTRPKLLGLNGRLGADGIPTINGIKWDSAEAGELVNQAVGGEVRLVQLPQPQAFDVWMCSHIREMTRSLVRNSTVGVMSFSIILPRSSTMATRRFVPPRSTPTAYPAIIKMRE